MKISIKSKHLIVRGLSRNLVLFWVMRDEKYCCSSHVMLVNIYIMLLRTDSETKTSNCCDR